MGYVDHIRAGQLEDEIRDVERELNMAQLNNRYDDIDSLKEELRDLERELNQLYYE